MKTSKKGKNLITKYEGVRQDPYMDSKGIPTIGIGNTYYADGTPVTMNDKRLTDEQVNELFSIVLLKFESVVNKYVTSNINQNQFDALVSFTYNVGAGNLKNSTLLKRVNNDPLDPDIKTQFLRWNKAGGKFIIGLSNRRKAEANYYFSEV